jgi:type II secretory pathway pseudopilin PulG
MHCRAASGFSLVSVLIAIAIVGVLATGLASLSHNMSLTTATSEFGTDLQNAMAELGMALNDPATCGLNLKGLKPTTVGAGVSSLYFPVKGSTTKLSSNPILTATASNRYAVKSMKVIANPATDRIANLQVVFQSKGNVLGGATRVRNLPLQVGLSGAGAIVTCSAQAGGASPSRDCDSLPAGLRNPSSSSTVELPVEEGGLIYAYGAFAYSRSPAGSATTYLCINHKWAPIDKPDTPEREHGSGHYGG